MNRGLKDGIDPADSEMFGASQLLSYCSKNFILSRDEKFGIFG